jgi:histidyl-tRNA synthetase
MMLAKPERRRGPRCSRGPARRVVAALAEQLRDGDFAVDLGYRGNLSRRMKQANKVNARAAVIIGDNELARGVAAVRDLDTGEQEDVPLSALAERLVRFR